MRLPKYRMHKPTGQAVVTFSGKDFYLGIYDSPESHEKYRRLLSEYIASNASPAFGERPDRITMAQVVLAYLKHAEAYYGNGSEYKNLVLATKPVSQIYADSFACNFGPEQFKACRAWQSKEGRSRQYVNKLSKMLLRIIKWAVSEGMMPASIHMSCQCVQPLKLGRTELPESKPIKMVDDSKVNFTIEFLSPVLADMVRFQRLTGARPGEVCSLKPCMIDRSRDVWLVRLDEHKTAHRGLERYIAIGPKAQAVLSKYLLRDASSYCFTPKESERKRRIRSVPLNYGNRPGKTNTLPISKRTLGDRYTTLSYGKAIKYACEKAIPEPEDLSDKARKEWRRKNWWSPNQLRHSRATEIRKSEGLEAASVSLGHSGLEVTQIYAERDIELAIAVARKLG